MKERGGYTALLVRWGILLIGVWLCLSVRPAQAQLDRPQRQIRTFVPPEQLVSFAADTSITAFFDAVNPLFEKVTGKQIIDAETRTGRIKIDIEGLYFFDAFELVLEANGLTYRETPQYFIIEGRRRRKRSQRPSLRASGGAS